jgi:hypothetical protein
MRYSENTNEVVRRYNGVFRRYHWGIQKIPMGYSEDTNGLSRRYHWGIQKIPME